MSFAWIAGIHLAVDAFCWHWDQAAQGWRIGTMPGTADVDAAGMSVTTLRRPGNTIAVLQGALDITTAPALREQLLGVLGPGVKLLTIDVSGVSHCDVAGLAVLIGTQRCARTHGITVRLTVPSPQVVELLHVTGLDRSLTVCATPDDGLPALRPGLRAATLPPPTEAAA